jgi:hypothetical protein
VKLSLILWINGTIESNPVKTGVLFKIFKQLFKINTPAKCLFRKIDVGGINKNC